MNQSKPILAYITRVETFNAAHRLWVSSWSEEENFAVFGKCANKNFHGHNFELRVTVKGCPHPLTGFIIDAKKLGDLIRTEICEVLDHSNINLDENFIPKTVQPTIENMVYYIWQQLEPKLPEGCKLHRVLLQETPKIYAEYLGE